MGGLENKKGSDFSEPFSSGEGGIRTPGRFPYASFQDWYIRPLCHFTAAKIRLFLFLKQINEELFYPDLEFYF